MTTEFSWFNRVAPRGSIVRFGLAGCFNSACFFTAWTVSVAVFPSVDVRMLWGLFWGLTGVLSHFIHRWFTFDGHKPLRWTLSTAIPTYIVSMVGSSLTIGWLKTNSNLHLNVLGLVNLAFWGLVVWATLRWLVFQFSDATGHASRESPTE